MHIEHLSHWSGHLNREMYLNRYGHAGIPVVVFASSGGSHNEYYDFGMIDACASLSKKVVSSSLPYPVWTVRAGWPLGKTVTTKQRCTVPTNVM